MSNYWYGLDLSLTQTGVAVFDMDKMDFVYVGSFNTEKIYATKQYKGLYLNGLKLKKLFDFMNDIFEKFPPSKAIIEKPTTKFYAETMALGRVHGIINCRLWDIQQEYLLPSNIKLTVSFEGNATKQRVQQVIQKNFPHLIMNNEDESDACSIILASLIQNGLITWEKPVKIVKSTKSTKPKKPKKEVDKCK
jgi:Holliday junction resolvasome RuvABC endonuclease subunit